jgi:hypothetical protein
MSDHVAGPRQIGDPSADLTDLFAFISPADPNRTVLAANVVRPPARRRCSRTPSTMFSSRAA